MPGDPSAVVASDGYVVQVHSSIGAGLGLLVIAVLLAGLGLWSVIRTPPQLLWGQRHFGGRVNGFNNWMFNDKDGSEPSPGGRILLRFVGCALVAASVVVLIIAIKWL